MLGEELYWVNTTSLTSKELRASNLPNDGLQRIIVDLKSKRGKSYRIEYTNYYKEYSPHILLMLHNTDKTDFEHVKEVIAAIHGIPPSEIKLEDSIRGGVNLHGDIKVRIKLPKKLKQRRIAVFVESMQHYFNSVKILAAYFKDVPKRYVDNSGLSLEKLIYGRMDLGSPTN